MVQIIFDKIWFSMDTALLRKVIIFVDYSVHECSRVSMLKYTIPPTVWATLVWIHTVVYQVLKSPPLFRRLGISIILHFWIYVCNWTPDIAHHIKPCVGEKIWGERGANLLILCNCPLAPPPPLTTASPAHF